MVKRGVISLYAIEISNLTKSYGKARGIVGLTLNINKGEIFGFIGPNGAGKSTTIRTLLSFVFPTSGEARILGLDCIKDTKKIKQLIGYLPGEVNHYDDMSIKDLLLYSQAFYKKDCSRRIKELTEAFEVDTTRKIDTLSLGNKKKVGIIQALLHGPELLILDEPTSGLDPLMQKRFSEILKEENKKGTTIFFSSHVLSEVQRLCSRVAIIKEGKIIKLEKISDLTENNYKKFRIETKEDIKKDFFEQGGISNFEIDGRKSSFLFKGNIDHIMKKLSNMEILNIWIEEPSLEEIFMHYYDKEV